MKSISLILKTYLLALSIFFVFRLILFITEIHRVNISEELTTILYAFLMGVRFDIVVSGYILCLPALILIVMDILNIENRFIKIFTFYWIFIFFTLAFGTCAADIPYFNHFFSRFSIGAFTWFENIDFVVTMIYQEPKYYSIIFPFVGLLFFFYYLLRKIFQNKTPVKKTSLAVKLILSVLFLGLIFLGIRGRIQKKSPIRIGTAYFSNHPFLNQLGLNPVFTFATSYIENQDKRNQPIHLINSRTGVDYIQNQLNIRGMSNNSPIARDVIPKNPRTDKPNVIIIIMESMSAGKMKRHGNKNNLTPFLDSLSQQSLYFNNIYTSGKHTFSGVFSTLFAFPTIFRQHPMKTIKRYNGISNILRNYGYTTTYFTTHDGQFDNVEGFLHANDFENVISEANYPRNKTPTTLGVPDDYMFEFSIPIIDELSSKKRPFFVTYMTASDHGPYYVPDYFFPASPNIKHQIVEYADWSLKKYINMASEKSWFYNTIFVFVADHGAPISVTYDISLNYFHTPLIFYAPGILDSIKSFSCIGGQVDIFPTLMGLLSLPYKNNTLGIDLIREKRQYIMINDDDKIGVLDNMFLMIMKNNENNKLFKYKELDKKNYAATYPEKVKEMELYAKANMQIFQDMIINNQLYIESVIPGKNINH